MHDQIKEELDKETEKLRKLKKLVLFMFILSAVGGILIMFAEYAIFELFWR
ncbi:MAG TPA: hypothetical protein P5080_04580 [Candidatus Paceibacterota bacterium]|nr:hypothetical protein [Candidatus Pacearchaeota archaeon]HRZ51226.1 hypothetical protein [Candidatus Paceibacterota bacterium]HSA36948.1 hypothetical protein [Candidatus Paceibacterota bacterium]